MTTIPLQEVIDRAEWARLSPEQRTKVAHLMLAEIDRLRDLLAQSADDLAAATQTIRERTEAVLAIHAPTLCQLFPGDPAAALLCERCDYAYPCPTARAVGVTDQRSETND